MKSSPLLAKQLLVAKFNLMFNSNFLIFLTDELVKCFKTETNFFIIKIQKWIYNNSIITGNLLNSKFAAFPMKIILLDKGKEIFILIHNLNGNLKLITIKWINLFIQATKFYFDCFYYFLSFDNLSFVLCPFIRLILLRSVAEVEYFV